MAKRNLCSVLRALYLLIFLFGILLYGYVVLNDYSMTIPRTIGLYLSVFGIVSFLCFFRAGNLFCFEILFFPIYFLGVFFPEIVLNNIMESVNSYYYYTMSGVTENKSIILQTTGLFGYLLGAANSSIKFASIKGEFCNYKINNRTVDYQFWARLMSFIILIYFLFLYGTGVISSWFHYSHNNTSYSNLAIVYLTIFFLLATAFEFTKLSQKGIHSLGSFIKSIDKLYLSLFLVICGLLLFSGNRNEFLLIFMPPIIAYSIFIRKLENKFLVILLFSGVIVMIIIGFIRQMVFGVGDVDEIGLFESTRDFGVVNLNTAYLIEYTDKNGPIYFQNMFMFLVSSIPFLGTIFTYAGFEFATRTAELTTLGLQEANNMESGFGTALIGDIYYSGAGIGVFVYMVAFGYLMSYLYMRFTYMKRYNIWLLIAYLFLFSNAVYCVRAEWTMPFRYLGFSYTIVILLLALLSFKKK